MTQPEIKSIIDELMLILPSFAFVGGWFMGWWMRGDVESRKKLESKEPEGFNPDDTTRQS